MSELTRRVVVYRNLVLPLSETFVRDQIIALTDWEAVLVGESKVEPSPVLDCIRYQVAYSSGLQGQLVRRLDRISERVLRRSWVKSRMLQAARPDLVHVHFATDAVHLWPTLQSLGLPLLVTLHGFDIHTHAAWWRAGHGGDDMRSYPDRLLAMAADPRVVFVAVSQAVRRAALAYGLPADRVVVRHIGVDTRKLEPGPIPIGERPRHVLFVGRMIEKKGARFLIRAAAVAREQVANLRLILIGDGPDRPALEAEAARLGVDAEFLGAQPHEEVLRRFSTARAFCLPSIKAENGDAEGLPIVILESQAFGVPVIASAEAAHEEAVLDGITGFAFAERDVETLAGRLVTVLTDDARANAMSKAAVEFAGDRFDIAKCTLALEDLYSRVASLR